MAISERLKSFLDASKVKYTVGKHPVVYTAQEIAASQHVPGGHLAKCVLVNTDAGPVLAVLPAIHLIDLKRLKALLKARTLTIAKEPDVKQRFPDIEVGAMSPFGNLYQVPVVADASLASAQEIVFNAGSHTETIALRYQDFEALVKPKSGVFGQPVQGKPSRTKGKPAPRAKKRPAAAPKAKPRRAVKRRGAKRRR